MFDRNALMLELLRRKRMQEMMAQSPPLGALANMTVGQLVALLTGGNGRGGMLPSPVGLPAVGLPAVVMPDVGLPAVVMPDVGGPPADPGPVDPVPVEPDPYAPAQS